MIRHGRGSKPPSWWELMSGVEKLVFLIIPPLLIFIIYQIIFN